MVKKTQKQLVPYDLNGFASGRVSIVLWVDVLKLSGLRVTKLIYAWKKKH